jgi:UDP-N-acetylglucosamine acyltransferase
MATHIDPMASVSPSAVIDDDVSIGPFCVVGPDVRIGRGTRLQNNVTLTGHTTIGADNQIFPGVVIGAEPQDLSYTGTPTRVVVGDRNTIRECVTINRGTEKEEGLTELGSDCFLMANCHIAHDCRVGDRVIMANAVLLGGHVHVAHDVMISGGVAIHHFASIGCYSFVGGLSRVLHDVPPYTLADGNPARPRCPNTVGLKRNEFSDEVIRALSEAFRLLYRAKVGLERARESLASKDLLIPAVHHLLRFIQTQHEGRHGRGRERRKAA